MIDNSNVDKLGNSFNSQKYTEFGWTGSFEEYLGKVKENPKIARSAFQRIYDMILSHGTEEYVEFKKKITRFKVFDDPFENGKEAVFGIDIALMKLVSFFKGATQRYGSDRRILLLKGPVGSSKSTIVRLLKKGLEEYSKTDEGALYSFSWKISDKLEPCPMNEEPLRLIPNEKGKDEINIRVGFLAEVNEKLIREKNLYKINLEGDLCPSCRVNFKIYLAEKKGNWSEMVKNNIQIRRVVLSEKDRVGIGTFQPKDEKNQDSTELTGDINYRKIVEYGSDSDPRAFNFDGEFNVANRGLIEFIEVLKLEVAFLYDLLGASQEHLIKPKKFAQTPIDEVIIGHTNEPEYIKLQNNEYMEALRDRTVKIDIPYITKVSKERKIYEKDYNSEKVQKHIAPHTLEIAAMWAVLTRLENPKKANLSLLQKLKLYDGKTLTGYSEDNVKELRKESQREGFDGISPRYIQDKISNALVNEEKEGNCVNPFMVLNELQSGLKHHALLTGEEQKKKYGELLSVVEKEYEDIVKSEVQRAISADEEALKKLCGNYIDNIKAFTQKEKIINKFTGQKENPDEKLMRSIEDKIDIPDSRKNDFRTEIMNYIGALALEGKTFNYKTNERLYKALELKSFEDQKDSIKLTSLVSSVIDKETQEKIDVVKTRLMKNYEYCDVCSTDVLNYVASIFARGDAR